jgi:DNA polymerase III delta prime subunit
MIWRYSRHHHQSILIGLPDYKFLDGNASTVACSITKRSQSQCTITTITITMDTAAAATAPADMELESALSSDDEQQTEPNSKKRRRSTNTDLYELFTTEGVPGDPKTKQGTAFVHCKACVRHNETMAKENENRTAVRKKKIVPVKKVKRIPRDCQTHIQGCANVPISVKTAHGLEPKPLALARSSVSSFASSLSSSKPAPKSSRKAAPASRLSGFGASSSAPITIADVSPAKSFCVAGPCDPDKHYYLENRTGTETILREIDQGSYCYLYGPPQTGKTTTCLQLAQELNQGGTYCAVRLSVAAAKWYDKADDAWQAVLESWDRDIYSQLSADLRPTPGRNMRYYADGFREPIPEAISRWAFVCPRPLVLFIDDLQALANNGSGSNSSSGNTSPLYHSFLSQLLSGFHDRPKNFAYSICLVGESHRLPSHFNIVSESIRLPNFSRPQVEAIMEQMEVDSSHHLEDDAKERIVTLTQGQPWVVNAFGMILTNKMVEHHKMTFTIEHVNTVLAMLIDRMDPFLRHIADIARDRIYGPILKQVDTQQASYSHELKLEYLLEQGILSKDPTNGKYFLTCPDVYSELIDQAPASL